MPPPYPQQFRDRVLARLDEPGVTVDQVAREFGINRNSVRNWKRQRQLEGDGPPVPERTEDLAELRRLGAENARLREERDILKKAAAFFAEEERRRR
jgi:transposase-like protein